MNETSYQVTNFNEGFTTQNTCRLLLLSDTDGRFGIEKLHSHLRVSLDNVLN